MIVSLASIDGDVALEETGFAPASFGQVLSGALQRRSLSVEEVAARSGLTQDVVRGLVTGQIQLDRLTARKLQTVFPRTMRLFLNIQRSYDFYRRHGVLRPTSHLRRAMIKRRTRRTGG
jgi:plasmid maintenance system antidote protein VapI